MNGQFLVKSVEQANPVWFLKLWVEPYITVPSQHPKTKQAKWVCFRMLLIRSTTQWLSLPRSHHQWTVLWCFDYVDLKGLRGLWNRADLVCQVTGIPHNPCGPGKLTRWSKVALKLVGKSSCINYSYLELVYKNECLGNSQHTGHFHS